MNKATENLGDYLSYLLKFCPSFNLPNALMYATSKAVLNDTRAYKESEIIYANRWNETLPNRTHVTLDNRDFANMGGDLCFLVVIGVISSVVLFCEKTEKSEGWENEVNDMEVAPKDQMRIEGAKDV